MKITRFIPTFPLGHVADFDTWMRNPFAALPLMDQWLSEFVPGSPGDRPAADVHGDADNYYVRFELPGVKKDDIKVEVHDRLLSVHAERRERQGDPEGVHTLSRSISVPDEGVNAGAITAKLEDGVLLVTLPKQEHRKPRLIEIN
jgi:HSP20 family protein